MVTNEYWHEAINWTPEKSPKYQEYKKYNLPPQCFHSDFIKGLEYTDDWKNGMGLLLDETDMIEKNWQGVYFCCREVHHFFPELSEIWYIGKSSNLRERWKNHHKAKALQSIGFVSLYFLRLDGWSDSDIAKIERKYIDLFKPVFNDVTPTLNDHTSNYDQGFKDGCEKTRQSASNYYLQEIAKLHAQNLELRQRLGL